MQPNGLTVQRRTAFSAGLYDMLNTGNLEPLKTGHEQRKVRVDQESSDKHSLFSEIHQVSEKLSFV